MKFKVKCNNVYGWLKARSLSSKRRKHWLKNPIWTERLISVLHPLFMMNGAKFRYTLVVCWINAGILWCDFGVAITVFLAEMKMLTLIMLYGNCCQGNCPNLHKSSLRECRVQVDGTKKIIKSKKNLCQILNSYWYHFLIWYWLIKYFFLYDVIVSNVMCWLTVVYKCYSNLTNLYGYKMPEYTNRVINLDLQWNHLQIIWSFKICVHYIEN